MSNSQLKIKTKALPNSRIAIEFEVPAQQCKTSFEDALTTLCKSANLPGFRKGKVPKSVILQQIGSKRIQASALEKLLEKIWKQALKEESIEPLCEPELAGGFEPLLENFNPEQTLSVTLETDVAPIPKLKTTKGLTTEAEPITFDESKVDELIEESRKQLATVIPVENRPANHSDIAILTFKGTFADDGSEIEGGSGESMEIDLEEGRMIPGFIEGIVGMKINETKTIDCQFPKDYQDEKAKGRKAKFDIQLQDLKTRELPKLDDDFAKQASDKNSLKELRNELTNRLKSDAKNRNKKNRQESLLEALVKELEVDLPKTLIDEEVRNLIEQTARNFAEQGMDIKSTFTQDLVSSLMESSRPEAEINLKKNLALNALAEAENIKVDSQALEEKIKEVNIELANQKNIDQKKLRQVVQNDLLQEKLFDWLEANNTILEKKPKKALNEKVKSSKPKNTQKKTDKTKKDSP
ncbi:MULTISPECIES: trigger factor [Prochlorococcus]|uniref:Trigger factor n=1 Tax=Prochlorococcus marinus (strain SARG / CCMP1375 / SS120) TaxID=167539 RepID=TIG_PROMA|nr:MULTISPECIES: trigger factor [Prochlorococcus]Q7V9L7.1 RecName: Full=Trigger factor; Short=TF; AltName: Full=PPIase [Prochlorococcus marinus subsp. marinus str. CCMP1375]AAQ00859.1 FKBP-type peptidyl-prolyl cis-trans isomerase [Prochlorococcus marinus subsp. marinus str. CCMP1375]KGG10645.1 Cell division trigger factor [Prochlorococcus marinus str. LG]KGG19889.1 Cell division trigger factor [Prochlorococcus marinus str. SS2]KGG23891.1 Cell division trigger factor [Prochlorococcus marinus st